MCSKKAGVQGLCPCRDAGCPRNTSFSLFARRRRRRAGDENVGAQPQAPGEGRQPFTIPLKLTPKGDTPASGLRPPAPPADLAPPAAALEAEGDFAGTPRAPASGLRPPAPPAE